MKPLRLLTTLLALLIVVPMPAALAQEEEAPDREAAEPADDAPKSAQLIEQLRSTDPEQRAQAAQALGEAKVEAAVPELIKLLDDPNEDAQWRATVALGTIGEPAVSPLIDALMLPTERARWKAESALKMIGTNAVPGLIQALDDRRARIRQSAAFLLGEIQDPNSLNALAKAMGDKDKDTRWKAATSLTKFGTKATDAVVKALAKGPIEARRCAAWALQQTRDADAVPHLIRALKDPDEQVRWKAAIALQKIGRPAADPLFDILRSKPDENLKSMATWILEGIKDIAVQTALRDIKGARSRGGKEEAKRPKPKTVPDSVALVITSKPAKATVFVDDKYAGVTPLTVAKLSPGHHFIKLTKRDHLPWTKLVELLYPQERIEAKLALKPKGSLIVTSEPPEADVYIDGEYEGKTPLTKEDLDANPYSVRIEKEHFQPWETEVEVAAGREVKAHGTLESKVESWYLARLKENPNDASGHTELAHYYLVRGRLQPCVRSIAKAIEVTGKGDDTSGYRRRLIQEIDKMWSQTFQFGGNLKLAEVRHALHATIHKVWKQNSKKDGFQNLFKRLKKSVGTDFTKPPK